jgi:hypothetical protein
MKVKILVEDVRAFIPDNYRNTGTAEPAAVVYVRFTERAVALAIAEQMNLQKLQYYGDDFAPAVNMAYRDSQRR